MVHSRYLPEEPEDVTGRRGWRVGGGMWGGGYEGLAVICRFMQTRHAILSFRLSWFSWPWHSGEGTLCPRNLLVQNN